MGGWMPDDYAMQALRAALHLLRDELTMEQNAHLAAQLPIIIRGIYYENWVPSRTPARERHEEAFLRRVPEAFRGKEKQPDPSDVLRAVFAVLHRHLSVGESEKVYKSLPQELRRYWPAQTVFTEVPR